MHQESPDPKPLRDLVDQLRYSGHDDLRFSLHDDYDRGQGCKGLTLIILRIGPDSYDPDRHIAVNHLFPVPAAAYGRSSWMRWLFDRIGDVELHERMENFAFCTGRGTDGPKGWERPYRPNHGFGEDPYIIHDVTTDEARRRTFRNELNPG